jgi:Zn-finger nucleic acid-binding protein
LLLLKSAFLVNDVIHEWETKMKCPNCVDTLLTMADRQGVEIDYCPACRGVWLDRGELDKLLEKASVMSAGTSPARSASAHAQPPAPVPTYYKDDSRYQHSRRKSWLEDIFD